MYVLIEGIDGVGKTELCQHLAVHLNAEMVHEPMQATEHPLGALLRSPAARALHPIAQETLFRASEVEHQLRVIHPALEANKNVVQDRGYPSAMIYQPLQMTDPAQVQAYLLELHTWWSLMEETGLMRKPDYMILLDAKVSVVAERLRARGGETVDVEELTLLRHAYRKLWLGATPEAHAHIVDASGSREETLARVLEVLGVTSPGSVQ